MGTSGIQLDREEIAKIIRGFSGKNVLVIGDVMVDAYFWGDVERISPEAPVPVVNIRKKEYRLGGAANVALNIKRLGGEPVICSVIGEDQEAEIFLSLLEKENISAAGLVFSDDRPTTLKTRVLGGRNQMIRLDSEDDSQIGQDDSEKLLMKISGLMESADVIIFEDYDKGILSEHIISEIISMAREKEIPVAVDPKKKNFLSYKGVTLFKPNLRELSAGIKVDLDHDSELKEIEQAVLQLRDKINADCILLTLSEKGIYILDGQASHLIPAHVRNIFDVSGAGDTVIAVAALCLTANVSPPILAAISNLAGGLVCEKPGVVPISAEELMNEAVSEFS